MNTNTHPAAVPHGAAHPRRRKIYDMSGLRGQCSRKAPCGRPCGLDAGHRHHYHSCDSPNCPHCHAPERFGRGGAERVVR